MSDTNNTSQSFEFQSNENNSKVIIEDYDEKSRENVAETPRIHVEPSSLPALSGQGDDTDCPRHESDSYSDAYSGTTTSIHLDLHLESVRDIANRMHWIVANRYNRALGHVADYMRVNVIIDLPTSNDTSSTNNLSSVGVMELSLIVERSATIEKLARMVEAEYAFRYMEASIRADQGNDTGFDDSLVVAMDIIAVVFQSNTVFDFDQVVGDVLSSGDEVRAISVFYGQSTAVTITEIVRRRLDPVHYQQGNLKRTLTLPSLNKDYVANAFALLHNFSTLKNMLDFCVQRDQIESLLFWLEVEVFRGLCLEAIGGQEGVSEYDYTSISLSNPKYENLLLHARYIYLTFLGHRATLRLNIPSELHQAIEWPIPRLHPITGLPQPLDPGMFDEIQEHVYQFVSGFLCSEYLESTHYATYMKSTPPNDDDFIVPGEHYKRFPQNRDNFEKAIAEALIAVEKPDNSFRSASNRSFDDSLDVASVSMTGSDMCSNIGSTMAVTSGSDTRRDRKLSVQSGHSNWRTPLRSHSASSSMNVGMSGSRVYSGSNMATSGSRVFSGSRMLGSRTMSFTSGSGLFNSNMAMRGSSEGGSSAYSPPHARKSSIRSTASHLSSTFSAAANSNPITNSSNTNNGSFSSMAVALSDRGSIHRSISQHTSKRHSIGSVPVNNYHIHVSTGAEKQIRRSKKQAMVKKEKKLAKFFGDRPKHEDAYTEATTSGFIPKLQVEAPSASNSFDNGEERSSPAPQDDNDDQSITYNFMTRNARPVSKAKKIQKLNEFFGQQVPQEVLFEKRIRESLTSTFLQKTDLTQEDKRQLMIKIKKLRSILGEALDAQSTEALTESFSQGKRNRRISAMSEAASDTNASLMVLVSQAKLHKDKRRKRLDKISNFLGERISPQMLKDLESLLLSDDQVDPSVSSNDESLVQNNEDNEDGDEKEDDFPGADGKEKMILRYLIETGSYQAFLNQPKVQEHFSKHSETHLASQGGLSTADSDLVLNDKAATKKRADKLSKFFGELPNQHQLGNSQPVQNTNRPNSFKVGFAGIKTKFIKPKFIAGTLTPMQLEEPEPISPTGSSRRMSSPAPI